jgi:hypothetical protein
MKRKTISKTNEDWVGPFILYSALSSSCFSLQEAIDTWKMEGAIWAYSTEEQWNGMLCDGPRTVPYFFCGRQLPFQLSGFSKPNDCFWFKINRWGWSTLLVDAEKYVNQLQVDVERTFVPCITSLILTFAIPSTFVQPSYYLTFELPKSGYKWFSPDLNFLYRRIAELFCGMPYYIQVQILKQVGNERLRDVFRGLPTSVHIEWFSVDPDTYLEELRTFDSHRQIVFGRMCLENTPLYFEPNSKMTPT